MVKCAIVDDEPLAQQVIERYIRQCSQLELIAICSNAIEAHNLVQQQPVDLLFLDIKMPLISGIDLIKSLEKTPAVILTTAFSEYAVQGYELDAVDYLLKPITFPRFKKSIDKFLKQSGQESEPLKNYLYIKVSGKLVRIFHADILYIESLKDYLRIATIKEKYITHLTLKSLVGLLPPGQFIRVHRSYIINTDFISVLGKKEVTINNIKIPVGDNFKVNLLKWNK